MGKRPTTMSGMGLVMVILSYDWLHRLGLKNVAIVWWDWQTVV
jgi:hypothetical protein